MTQTDRDVDGSLLAGRLVLVAEDQFLVAQAVQDAIEAMGGRVLGPVASVASALEQIAAHRPDLAMLDVDLNGEQVYPVAEKLRRDGVPFAFTTGFDHNGMSPRFKDMPYLTKPIRHGALVQMLRDLSQGR